VNRSEPYRDRAVERAVIQACHLVGVPRQDAEDAITRWYHQGQPEPCTTGNRARPGQTCRCRGCIQSAVAQMCNIAKQHLYGDT